MQSGIIDRSESQGMKKLLIGLTGIGAVVVVQMFALDQYDRVAYERRITNIGQSIVNRRDELARNNQLMAEYSAQGLILNEMDGANRSLEWTIKAYKGLDFCIRIQRFLLRPSDEAWIYCKKESKLKGE
jgi:hypothetical protein